MRWLLLLGLVGLPAHAADRARMTSALVRATRDAQLQSILSTERLAGALRARAVLSMMLRSTGSVGDQAVGPARDMELERLALLPVPAAAASPLHYRAPVAGRLLDRSGAGMTLSAAPGERITAPAAGRVAFAGPYRGYGVVLILDHGNGWKTLLTGLGNVLVPTGDAVRRGEMVGRAGPHATAITLELHRDGRAVDPVPLMAGR